MAEAARWSWLAAWSLLLGIAGGAPPGARAQDAAPAAEPHKLDLNRASPDELLRVPQLGRSTVERIVRGRPYRSVDDLARVGVSARTIESLREIVVVGPPAAPAPRAKIDLNSADEETLRTLPGVGPTLARAIVAGRPYASVEDLGRVRGLTPARFAAFRDRVVVTPPRPKSNETTVRRAAARPPIADPTEGPPAGPARAGELIDLNTASQAELESLPRIGPAKARAIIEHRPYAAPEDVMKVPGIKQGTFDQIKDRVTVGTP